MEVNSCICIPWRIKKKLGQLLEDTFMSLTDHIIFRWTKDMKETGQNLRMKESASMIMHGWITNEVVLELIG